MLIRENFNLQPCSERKEEGRDIAVVVKEDIQKLLFILMNTLLGSGVMPHCAPLSLSDKSLQPVQQLTDYPWMVGADCSKQST